MVVRQRVPARPVVPRPLLRRRWADAAAADDGPPRRRSRDHRHVDHDGDVRERAVTTSLLSGVRRCQRLLVLDLRAAGTRLHVDACSRSCALSTMAFGAVAVGIAAGALDEIIALFVWQGSDVRRRARWRRTLCSVNQLGRRQRRLSAARAALHEGGRGRLEGWERWPAPSSTRGHGHESAAPRRGSWRQRRRVVDSGVPGPVAARPCTRPARCSAGSATSTR